VLRPRELSRSIASFAARTPTLPPATHTNSYALGAREVLLVEPATPYEDEQRAWIAWARALPSSGRTLVAIVVTHHHPDHVGGVDVLSSELGLPVWAHEETAARIDTPVARRLAEGDVLDLAGPAPERWRVLHTPGHAAGHVVLHDEDSGTLVVGDMVASVGTILIAPGEGDMKVYIEQLERLAGLEASLALPAHGDPIDAPTALFRHYITHRRMREAKALAAVERAGPAGATAGELLAEVYDDVPPATWPIALLSLQAHLEKLEREGRLRTRAREGSRTETSVHGDVRGGNDPRYSAVR
jgi:glyoxylase-like metal-dependent hydrolase (beta-lactamase superfamily II)